MSFFENCGTLLRKRVWCAMDVIGYFFVIVCQSLSCAYHRCFATAIDMLGLVDCWNHIDCGFAVRYGGIHVLLDSSLPYGIDAM